MIKKLRVNEWGGLTVTKLASAWGEEKENGGKAIYEEQMAENFQELMKDKNSQI